MADRSTDEPGRCAWIKDDGERCRRPAGRGDQLCWTHRAMHAYRSPPTDADTPTPAGIDVAVVAGLALSVVFGVIVWTGLIQSGRWVGWSWIGTVRAWRDGQYPPDAATEVLAWLAANSGSGVWVVATVPLVVLMLTVFPMRPSRRRRWMRILIGTQMVGLALQVGSLLVYFWAGGRFASLGTIPTDLPMQLAATALAASVLRAADKLDTRAVDALATPLIAAMTFIKCVQVTVTLGEPGSWQEPVFWILGQILSLLWALPIFLLTITRRGRVALSRTVHLFVIGRLADALRPASAVGAGPHFRSDALQSLVGRKGRLTDEERRALAEELLSERRSNWIRALVTLVLAQALLTIFVNTPAQQLFFWGACTWLELGEPLCPAAGGAAPGASPPTGG